MQSCGDNSDLLCSLAKQSIFFMVSLRKKKWFKIMERIQIETKEIMTRLEGEKDLVIA